MERDEIERLREKNLKDRQDVLDPYAKLWDDNCRKCRLVSDAVKTGELPEGMTKDRQNAVCDRCPTQKALWDIGEVLGETMREEQRLRKVKNDLYGESKRERMRRILNGEYDEK